MASSSYLTALARQVSSSGILWLLSNCVEKDSTVSQPITQQPNQPDSDATCQQQCRTKHTRITSTSASLSIFKTVTTAQHITSAASMFCFTATAGLLVIPYTANILNHLHTYLLFDDTPITRTHNTFFTSSCVWVCSCTSRHICTSGTPCQIHMSLVWTVWQLSPTDWPMSHVIGWGHLRWCHVIIMTTA